MRVLNVGCGNKSIPIPPHFNGWEHQTLDIDAKSGADVVCDARQIADRMAQGGYAAVYCSHNLEHYYRHDIPKVLAGFGHALEDDGFVEIHVPNMQALFEKLMNEGKDVEEVMYTSPAGPITALDMIYGYSVYIEASGNDFMCHKTGFTPKSLANTLARNGFPFVFVGTNGLDLIAYGFKNKPSDQQKQDLKLKDAP